MAQLNKEDLNKVRIRRYFDEEIGCACYCVNTVSRSFVGSSYGVFDYSYYWRTMKDKLTKEDANRYRDNYTSWLKEVEDDQEA